MPPPPKKQKKNTGPWSSSRILNASSPILGKDVQAFLITCMSGWDDSYDETEKRSIIDSLPERYRIYEVDDDTGKLKCPITMEFVLEDPHFKAGISKFKSNVEDGFFESRWQKQATTAMQERRQGKFDQYLKEHVEEVFGVDENHKSDLASDVGVGDADVMDTCQNNNQLDPGSDDSTDGEWQAQSGRSCKRTCK